MSKYVKNADLTLEYIVNRAYRLGAQSIYSDIRPGCFHSLVFEWGENHICSYAMQPCTDRGWNMNHADKLPSLRKSVENHGYYLRLQRELRNALSV